MMGQGGPGGPMMDFARLQEIMRAYGPPQQQRPVGSSLAGQQGAPKVSPLQRPGVSDALLQTGLGMMAGAADPGATGLTSLGRAGLQYGLPALQQGRENAAVADFMDGAPESLKRLMAINPRLAAQLQANQPKPTVMSGPRGSIWSIVNGEATELVAPGTEADARSGSLGEYDEWAKTNTGDFADFFEWKQGSSQSASRTVKEYTDENGQRRLGIYNPDTNRFDPVEGAQGTQPAGTEGERKAAAFLHIVPDQIELLDGYVGTPGRMETFLQNGGFGELTDAEQQTMNLAGKVMSEAWLRLTTGAAYTDLELNTAMEFFTPRAGDKMETLKMKQSLRQSLMRMLTESAGRLAPQGSDDPLGIR